MNRLLILLGLFFVFFVKVNAQTSTPTKKELMEYLRTKLLSYPDEAYGYKDIIINVDSGTMTLKYQITDYYQVIFFGNLDANSLRNDDGIYSTTSRRRYGQFVANSITGKVASVWYNIAGDVDKDRSNTATFFYDNVRLIKEGNLDKARIEKTIKALILACGGKESKELF